MNVRKTVQQWRQLLTSPEESISCRDETIKSLYSIINQTPYTMDVQKWLKFVPNDDGVRSILGSNQDLCERLCVDAMYEYLTIRQRDEIDEVKRDEALIIPEAFDYEQLQISNEAKQKLHEVRPATLGSATRIPGITPATIFTLLRTLKKTAKSSMATA